VSKTGTLKSQALQNPIGNWPFSKKDLEIYCRSGLITAKDRNNLSYRFQEKNKETAINLPERPAPFQDPFSFFKAVVRKEILLDDNDLSAHDDHGDFGCGEAKCKEWETD